jgi:hypothetical protein
MIENIFTATPAEIDTEIARLQGQLGQLHAMRDRAHRMLTAQYSTESERDEARAAYGEANGKISVLGSMIYGLESEYGRRGGWARYFVVDNNNGHLHTHTRCQNTYDTTEWVWMPGMSGMTKAEAVAEGGKLTCLSCFPEFREEIEAGREPRFETPRMRKTREEREALAAKKAQDKATKGITTPEGGELLDVTDTRDGGWRETSDVIKTAVAAQRKASQAAFDIYFYNVKHPASSGENHPQTAAWEELLRRCVEALAARDGKTVEELRTEIQKKVEAKYRREYKNSF